MAELAHPDNPGFHVRWDLKTPVRIDSVQGHPTGLEIHCWREHRLPAPPGPKALASSNAAQRARPERDFEILQEHYQPRPDCGYDAFGIFKRASGRAVSVIGLPGLETSGLRGLDLGAATECCAFCSIHSVTN